MSPDAALVWWLDRHDCEAIGDALPATFPPYLCEQYRSRLGRPAHGRLWIDALFGDVSVDSSPNTPLGRRLDRSGGIVIRAQDATLVHELPGVLTDMQLRRREPWTTPQLICTRCDTIWTGSPTCQTCGVSAETIMHDHYWVSR